MKIAIIGAGFTGLTAALRLAQKGHRVTIFERETFPGGLAFGYRPPSLGLRRATWQWPLEAYYHHWFTNDSAVLNLAKELGQEVATIRPKTSVYKNGINTQLDSPVSLLRYSGLSFINRIRMGLVLGLFKFYPWWMHLEGYRSVPILKRLMGKAAFNEIWKGQFDNKFERYVQDISLVWFWARVKKRTTKLAYPKGGYNAFIEKLVKKLKSLGVEIKYRQHIESISSSRVIQLTIEDFKGKKRIESFDKVIVTAPTSLYLKMVKDLPSSYIQLLKQLPDMGAVTLVLRLKKKLLQDGTYWLSIGEKSTATVVVEHTNFIDKKYYNNEHLVYVGKYVMHDDPLLKMSKEDILETHFSLLKQLKLNKKDIIGMDVFKAYGIQPIVFPYYSKVVTDIKTPIKNVYLANSSQVYPWDRGTNYAVELGMKVADIILSDPNDTNEHPNDPNI